PEMSDPRQLGRFVLVNDTHTTTLTRHGRMWAMDITSRAEFAATPEQVFTMLTDQGYLEQVCVASHALSYECSVQGSTTRSRRELPAPEQARKFTGASLTIVEEV